MKMLLVLLSFVFVLPTSIEAQIDYTQHSLISKRTATWCTNCGRHGWDMMEGVIEDTGDVPEAMALAVHISGDLQNEVSDIFVEYVGGSGQPQFFVNKQNIGLTRTNVEQKRGEVLDLVVQNAQQNSSVGFDAQASVQNDIIEVKTDFELAQDLEGTIKLGAYLVLNNFIHNQAARGSNASHKRLLWRSFTMDASGIEVEGAAGPNSQDFELNISDIDHPVENMQVIVVAWQELNGNRNFLNGRLLDVQEGTVSTADISTVEAKVYFDGRSIITDLGSTYSGEEYQIDIFTIVGQAMMSERFNESRVEINTDGWRAASYILKLSGQDWLISRKVMVVR